MITQIILTLLLSNIALAGDYREYTGKAEVLTEPTSAAGTKENPTIRFKTKLLVKEIFATVPQNQKFAHQSGGKISPKQEQEILISLENSKSIKKGDHIFFLTHWHCNKNGRCDDKTWKEVSEERAKVHVTKK